MNNTRIDSEGKNCVAVGYADRFSDILEGRGQYHYLSGRWGTKV